jgi:conjugative transfer ATPase
MVAWNLFGKPKAKMARPSKSDETVRFGRRVTDKPPTVARMRQMYERPTSFANFLPWHDYDPQSKCFLLDDGRSVAALFELRAADTEARPDAWLAEFRNRVQSVLTDSVPEVDPPWILQFYVQDELSLGGLADDIVDYVRPELRDTPFTQQWMALMKAHLADVSRSGGLFRDEHVSGGPWQARRRRVRVCLYRRRSASGDFNEPDVLTELDGMAERLSSALASAGIGAHRLGGQALYDWLFRWFNPAPAFAEGDTEKALDLAPYPGDEAEDRPYGYDLAETLVLGLPRYHPKRGLWWFDHLPHRCLVIQELTSPPKVGQLFLERRIGDHTHAVFDRMPEGTLVAFTITFQPQDQVRNHLARIERTAVGDYAEAELAGRDAHAAQEQIALHNKLFPTQTAIYVRGNDERQLRQHVNAATALLLANGLRPIPEEQDLIACDTYLRNLPMAYSHDLDRKRARRSRYTFSRHLAHLLPVYGRSVGTGHPGLLFFNRGGEPLTFDPLSPLDRKKNAHGLLLGPTGSGKSAQLVYFILQMLAIYRPRLFVVEVGKSFELLGQYLASQGLSVNQVMISPTADVSLPPFADAVRLLEPKRRARLDLTLDGASSAGDDPVNDFDEDDGGDADGERDLLGEMEIAARIMITGSDSQEDARMTRADRLLIREAILDAAAAVKAGNREHTLPEDVVKALRNPSITDDPKRLQRAREMADALALFCTAGSLEAHLFNRPGSPWPEVDVTFVDFGILAREGYEDKLTVTYLGLMNHITALVERRQHDDRPTLVITDEGHLITTNPLLAPYVIKITKMWRKLGAWFWIATQNLEDFPDASRRMLTMLEWWLCLVMPKDEINQIARFRDLTEEQKALLLAARKEPGKFVEGVVLTDQMASLFRSVPPALALALGMTEKDEKAARARLMKEHRCSELEAALMVAERLAEQRRAFR